MRRKDESLHSADVSSAIASADAAYAGRQNPRSCAEGIACLNRVANSNGLYEVQWRLARLYFVAGESEPALYKLGSICGLRAAKLSPRQVEGHFWAGVDLALAAEWRGGIRGAVMIRKAKRCLMRACSIAEDYHGAGPLRVLARLQHKAPRLLGGDPVESRRRFDRALSIAPNNSVTLVYAAELAIDRGEWDRAVDLLRRVEALSIDPVWQFEIERDKRLARTMLDRLSRLTESEPDLCRQ